MATLLVCRKCVKKLGDEGKALRKALKRAAADGGHGAVAVEKSDCFSLCPRGGVVVARRRGEGERRLVVLEPGGAPEAALDYVLAGPVPPPG